MKNDKLEALIANVPFVIAEVGNNHLGDPELAHRTLDAAADAGVDAVKFQLFDPDELVASTEPVLSHVPDNRFATQRERFRHMVLGREHFIALVEHARMRNVMFLCTPFDRESADFLAPLVPAFKIASGDASNFQLLDHVASMGKPMFVSTGCCTQDEVDWLVGRMPKDRLVIFHCVGSYPTPDAEASMSMIPYYASRYGVPVGYSDHTKDQLAPLLAVALGVVAIEKHFILDRSIPGGDRALSLTGPEMANLVSELRRARLMLGESSQRTILACERYGREKLRRSPYARHAVKAGEHMQMQDVILLRPEIAGAYSLADLSRHSAVQALRDIGAETPLTPDNSILLA
ncbi:MAG: N-acetylneuraminate synthase family protein [Candidatus Nitricoxidivorans perseverans]|uniref:N-acetylneuraminate synthase family protein n=1 Tax=Candidatus Nitricoxidivorans perseverans TaxID=2975601 RepID=A0AA49FKK0_9PROT|nr:MAG: N-acetylneuraminate synthase family protein [Candidatus Nitricoxidivorans perseverans]